jgi:glutathione peroxidase
MRNVIYLLIIVVATFGCSSVQKNNSTMTGKQKVLKAMYPIISGLGRFVGPNGTKLTNEKGIKPVTSIYDVKFEGIDGKEQTLAKYKGKKILLVNTASDCGYTGQYESLQKLYDAENGNLVIVGFPANDFQNQESGNNDAIASFCKKNYGVTFPLATKGVVIKSKSQQPIYQWLTNKDQNGWNDKQPSWNFSKYLINEEGVLINYFGPSIEPEKTVR